MGCQITFEFDIDIDVKNFTKPVEKDFQNFNSSSEMIYFEMIEKDPQKYGFLKTAKKTFEFQEIEFKKRFNQLIMTRMNGFDELGLAMKKNVEAKFNCSVHALRILKLDNLPSQTNLEFGSR